MRIRVQKPPKPGSFKKLLQFLKKGLLFLRRYGNIIKLISAKTEYGRLAQLVEHLLDVQEVTGSSPVPSTMIPRPFGLGIFCGGRYRTCTRSGLPFRSSCLPVQQEKEQQKSSSAEAELPGLRYGVNQRLLNWGARRAAFRPYYASF